MKEYKAKKGSHLNDKQAQKYGLRIAEIIKKKGKATPEIIVEDAKSPNAPYHDYFMWDDTIAANEHRKNQARILTSSIVEVVMIEGVQSEQRSFFSVSSENNGPIYVTVDTALQTPSYKNELLQKVIRHLENTTQLMKLFQQAECKRRK